MTIKSDLARVTLPAGISSEQLALALGLVVLMAIFFLRRPIFQLVKLLFKVVFTFAFLVAILSGMVLIYNRFGLLYAAGFIASSAALVFFGGRSRSGVGGSSDGHHRNDTGQEDIRRRNQEHQHREAERVRRVHEESIRRNRW